MVLEGQAFSWNPTIAGVKSEDTFLVLGGTQEIVTRTPSWPQKEVCMGETVLHRPELLQL